HRNRVACALAVEGTGENHVETFPDCKLTGGHLVKYLGGPYAEGARHARAVVRADETRAFQSPFDGWLQHTVERRIAGVVLEIRNHDGNRLVSGRRYELTLVPPRAGRERQQQHDDARDGWQTQNAPDWNEPALLIEAVERSRQFGCRLITFVRIRFETARDDVGKRPGHL